MEEERKYEKFYHTNGRLYAFIEMPSENLDTLIPEGAKWGSKNEVYGEDGELISSEQKIVNEFIIHKVDSLDGSACIIMLAAQQAPAYRYKGVTETDLDDWALYGEAVWNITSEDWLNVEEYRTLISGADYSE